MRTRRRATGSIATAVAASALTILAALAASTVQVTHHDTVVRSIMADGSSPDGTYHI